MGRVNSQTAGKAAAVPPPLTHFTHPHELHPLPVYSPQSVCSGCRLQSSGMMYACLPCAFTLHQSCARLPHRITHPSHAGCTLSLLTSPPYGGSAFSCDACARRGDGWSFHCTRCEYDLHVSCASRPMEIRHRAHASCDLRLTFENPYAAGGGSGFSCDVCRRIGSNQWLYRCDSCEFDAHLDCVAEPSLQHHHSLPTAMAAPLYHNQLVHSASTGGIGVNPTQLQGLNYSGQGYGSGTVPVQVQNSRPAPGVGLGGTLVTAAVQGLVDGAFQGVGQSIVQEFVGSSGGGGGDAGGAGVIDDSGGSESTF